MPSPDGSAFIRINPDSQIPGRIFLRRNVPLLSRRSCYRFFFSASPPPSISIPLWLRIFFPVTAGFSIFFNFKIQFFATQVNLERPQKHLPRDECDVRAYRKWRKCSPPPLFRLPSSVCSTFATPYSRSLYRI